MFSHLLKFTLSQTDHNAITSATAEYSLWMLFPKCRKQTDLVFGPSCSTHVKNNNYIIPSCKASLQWHYVNVSKCSCWALCVPQRDVCLKRLCFLFFFLKTGWFFINPGQRMMALTHAERQKQANKENIFISLTAHGQKKSSERENN